MKNIGILSMQEVHNYGSFLQAFALKQTIEGLGDNKVFFIPIENGLLLPEYKRTLKIKIEKGIERFLHLDILKRIKYDRLYHQRFANEFVPELIGNEQFNGIFDVAVIGSDEVFHIAQLSPWGFSPQLFGDVKNANKVISYAASFGATTLDIINKHGLKDEIAKAMNRLSGISVRDKNSYNIASSLSHQKIDINIDPVLLFDYTKYIREPEEQDYIVVYTYPNRIKTEAEVQAIKAFARKHGKKIITIGFYFPWSDKTVIPHPFEVLGYIKKASYVITDTFHGCVMSIINNKQFGTIVRDSNRNKMTSLLADYGLEGRLVSDMSAMDRIVTSRIDYAVVNNIIQERRITAKEYLKSHLES